MCTVYTEFIFHSSIESKNKLIKIIKTFGFVSDTSNSVINFSNKKKKYFLILRIKKVLNISCFIFLHKLENPWRLNVILLYP